MAENLPPDILLDFEHELENARQAAQRYQKNSEA